MSRYAIGYAVGAEDVERPDVVFMDAPAGVWMLHRGDPAPRVFSHPLALSATTADTVAPGEDTYFDVVLDTFSTNWVIRTVLDVDPPELISSMLLHGNEAWDALPRSAVPA